MPVFNKTILVDEIAETAGSTRTEDLPVNPLSYIDYRLTVLQNALNTLVTPANILGYITTLEVLLRGDPIISMSLADLAAYGFALQGHWPDLQNHGNLANQRISAVFRIPFGRRRFWTQEVLPPFRRGDLTLRAVYAAAFANAASVIAHIETQEILDATPTHYLKATTFTKTPTIAGDADSDLPIGNRILKVLLFSTTVPAGAVATTSADRISLLFDNVRLFYPETRWEEVHADFLARGPAALARIWNHQHMYDPTLAAANQTTDRAQGATSDLRQYGLLDFDPLDDPDMAYALITAGRSRVHMRINHGDTAAVRYIPAEVIDLAPRAA